MPVANTGETPVLRHGKLLGITHPRPGPERFKVGADTVSVLSMMGPEVRRHQGPVRSRNGADGHPVVRKRRIGEGVHSRSLEFTREYRPVPIAGIPGSIGFFGGFIGMKNE